MSGAALPVTVVIPAYNREPLLARTLESVRAQSRPPASILVVDDCSTDDSAAVAERLGARVIRHERNQGAAVARNTGFAAAETDWVALLDSDDQWLPWHLETLWAQRDGHVLVAGSALHLDARGRPDWVSGPPVWRDWVIADPGRLVFPENVIAASGALVRRDAVVAAGGYDETIRHSEDFDLWTRLLLHGSANCLARVTLLYRHHPGQKSRMRAEAGAAQLEIARRATADGGARLVDRRVGVRIWDDARSSARSGELREAARLLVRIPRRRQRTVGVLTIWVWRRMTRRRARALTAAGEERVVVLSGGRPQIAPGQEDWRDRPAWQRLLALVVSPPRRAVGGGRAERALCRALHVPVKSR